MIFRDSIAAGKNKIRANLTSAVITTVTKELHGRQNDYEQTTTEGAANT